MTLLVRTPAPHQTESLFGYLLRLSETNGYDNLKEVLRAADVGREQFHILPGLPTERIAAILGRDPAELSHLSYKAETSGSWHFSILGHDLGKVAEGSLCLRRPRLCVQCICDRHYIDAFWDLSAAVACPRHGCLALRQCHVCKTPLQWQRSGMLVCQCGANWTTAIHTAADTSTIEMMNIILAKLHHGDVCALPNRSGFPLKELANLPLRSLLRIVEILGTQTLWSRCLSDSEGTASVCAAVDSLTDWPAGFHRFLDGFGKRMLREKHAVLGFRKQFAPFFDSMFRNSFSAGDAEFLYSEFINFGLQHWGLAALDTKLRRSVDARQQRFISKSECARRYGIWATTMKRLIAEGTLVTRTLRAGRANRIVIDVQKSTLPKGPNGIISAREGARLLGLPVSVLKHLRHVGVLDVQPHCGNKASWHRDDIHRFLARGLAIAGTEPTVAETVELKDAMRLKVRDAKAKADIVAAVFDGRLTIRGRTGQTLGDIHLDKRQLDEFVLQKRVHVEQDTYSFPESAAKTGLDPAVVSDAVASGLLVGVTTAGRLRVSAGSVDRFNELYEPVSRVACRLGTTTRRLSRLCRETGVQVIVLRRKNRSVNQPILCRSSVQPLIEQLSAAVTLEGNGHIPDEHVYEK